MQINSHEYDLLPDNSLLGNLPTLPTIRKMMLYSRRLECVWSFIEQSYSYPELQLGQVAKHCGISGDYLNVLLKSFVNTTFTDLLYRYRIEKTLELFFERNYTITEIYTRCGFRSPATFDRQFKKWVGCLPREYKKLVRETLLKRLETVPDWEERKSV